MTFHTFKKLKAMCNVLGVWMVFQTSNSISISRLSSLSLFISSSLHFSLLFSFIFSFIFPLLSLFLLPSSFYVAYSVLCCVSCVLSVLCVVVCVVVAVACVVSPCVPATRAHVETHVRVLPAYTATFESRHGGALDGHTAVFQRATPHNTYRTPNTHTQHHTETDTERERECQMQVCFVARLSQRECVGNVVKCA